MTPAETERALIVAWLRKQFGPVERIDDWLVGLVDAIERGDHKGGGGL